MKNQAIKERLHFLHVFSRCNATSSINGKGKVKFDYHLRKIWNYEENIQNYQQSHSLRMHLFKWLRCCMEKERKQYRLHNSGSSYNILFLLQRKVPYNSQTLILEFFFLQSNRLYFSFSNIENTLIWHEKEPLLLKSYNRVKEHYTIHNCEVTSRLSWRQC